MTVRGSGTARKLTLSVIAGAALVVIIALAGCGGGSGSGTGSSESAAGTPQKGGTLRVADQGEAVNLDPSAPVSDNNSAHVFMQIIEPLYRTNSEGKVVPMLAETTTPSANFHKWKIQLRKGAKFSDGTPLNAEDVVFSLDKVRTNPTWKPMFEPITNVRAASANSVEITTDRPFPVLETTLSLFAAGIVPKDFGGLTEKEFSHHPMGTGPFKFGHWESGKSLTLEKNPYYWNPKLPYLNEIVFESVPDDESRTAQLRAGQLDLMAAPAESQFDSLSNTPGLGLVESELAFPHYLVLNLRKPAFKDIRVREAADLAIDRQGIVDAALNGHGKVGGSWFPPALEFSDPSIKSERNVEKAKALVAEAEKATGVQPSFKLMIPSGETYSRLSSQIMQEDLAAVGIKVTIEQIDEATAQERLVTGEYEATLVNTFTSDIIEPSEIVSFYNELEALGTGADTTEMAKLLEEVIVEPDPTKRGQIYARMQQIVAEEKNVLTVDYRPWTWALHDNVVGFKLPPTGIPWFAEVGLSG